MPSYPQIFRVRQRFDAPRIDDVETEVHTQLARVPLGRQVKRGQTVAITVGSRGIANIVPITRAIVDHMKGLGAQPFIVPAMGSHGGGTAEGQKRVVASYGISEQSVGCPIRAGMETVVVCRAAEGFPVHLDECASQADHILICNRVKPHTRFAGDIQSGLMKMMLIGLGNHVGARIYHRAVQDFGFPRILRSVAGEVLSKCSILAGVGIVENALDQTARIEAVPPEQFESREKELLTLARQWMPRLPFQQVDLLIIEQIGKDISGVGMDTNVIGRKPEDHAGPGAMAPKVKFIAVRGLSPQTHGNANGLGAAHFCRTGVLREMDVPTTRLNALTAENATAARIPLDYETDREILDAALGNIGLREPPQARMLWILNTLKLTEVECSEPYFEEARNRDDLEILSELRDLPLDAHGNLPEFTEDG